MFLGPDMQRRLSDVLGILEMLFIKRGGLITGYTDVMLEFLISPCIVFMSGKKTKIAGFTIAQFTPHIQSALVNTQDNVEVRL